MLTLNCNTRLMQKIPVWYKNALFDTKIHGVTQKWLVPHKNARPLRNIFFPILLKYFGFKNP